MTKKPAPQKSQDKTDDAPEATFIANVETLAAARALPEIEDGDVPEAITFVEVSIERFKAEDRRTMQIVRVGGQLASQPV